VAPASDRLTADDRFEIMELYARYAWAVDSGDLEELEKVVTEDARLIYIGRDFIGRDGAREMLANFLKDTGIPGSQHFYGDFIITGTGTEAHVRAYVARMYRMPRTSHGQMLWQGYYTDTCVKRDGAWFIHVRAAHPAESMRDQDFSQGQPPVWPPSLYHQGSPRKD
jgi:hypothetical protein